MAVPCVNARNGACRYGGSCEPCAQRRTYDENEYKRALAAVRAAKDHEHVRRMERRHPPYTGYEDVAHMKDGLRQALTIGEDTPNRAVAQAQGRLVVDMTTARPADTQTDKQTDTPADEKEGGKAAWF